jgi:serine/threonine protein kinase
MDAAADPNYSENPQNVEQADPTPFNLGLIGQRLGGRYLIEAPLGSGGMSVVYKGKQEAIDRTVAIKTLKLDLCSEPIILQRFEREVKGLSRLNHPNIVTVYDCIISPQGQPYVIMDYIDGESLEDAIKREKVIEPGRTIKLFMQVCQALEHAHRNGVVHRDIKPGNIMLAKGSGNTDIVKVVDFGLAKLMENTQRLTSTGQLWGSAPYMSPEQCLANEEIPIDHRSDIYSLGVVLYESLTGKDPYWSSDLMQTISNHVNIMPPPLKETNPDLNIAPALEAVVFKALEKAPANRFQSMQEFREALEHAGAPMLKAEEARHTREMQKLLDERQQRVQQQNKAKQATLKKAQQKEAIKVVPVIAITAISTLALTIGCVWFMNRNKPAPIPAPPPVVQSDATPSGSSAGSTAGAAPSSTPSAGQTSTHSASGHAAGATPPSTKAGTTSSAVRTGAPHAVTSAKVPAKPPTAEKPKHVLKHATASAPIKSPPAPKKSAPAAAPSKDAWSTLEGLHSGH